MTPAPPPPRSRVRFETFCGHLYVEHPATKIVGPMQLYPAQRQWAEATFEALDGRGRRRYRRSVYSMPKKSGKTALGAAAGLYLLLADPYETDREVYSIAWDLDQARLIWSAAKRMIRRSPHLQALEAAGTLAIRHDVIEYVHPERVRGAPAEVGIFRPLARDTKGLHGIAPSCVLCDETWNQPDYELLEAVSLPPTRRCPLELHFTYAGLRAQQVPGNPLWDLFTAWRAGTDPALYVWYRAGREANGLVPWITEAYLRERERALPANKFRRLHLNEWGAADAPFLTEAEVARIFATPVTPVLGPASRWVVAVDYGRTVDATAIVVARRVADGTSEGTVEIGEVRLLQGSRTQPVPLEVVERAILDVGRRVRPERVLADQWQMLASIERLRAHGVPITPVTIGPSYLNQITSNFLALARSGRLRSVPDEAFRAQLEAVVVKETYYGLRIDAGPGAGVRGHDDLVVAAAMAAFEVMRQPLGPALHVIRVPRSGRGEGPSAYLQRLRAAHSAELARQIAAARRPPEPAAATP